MGLARVIGDPREELTEKFQQLPILGTVDYLAPEQAIASKESPSHCGKFFWR